MSRINGVKNIKAKLILSLGYGCGLRRQEVIDIKLTDIQLKQRFIIIHGKGAKERRVIFSDTIAELLALYWREYKSIEYLFNGRKNNGDFSFQYSGSSILNITKRYVGKQYKFHQLRHSYATKMLYEGVDIATLSKLMGHNEIRTTMIYNHLMVSKVKNLPLPV